MGYCSMTCKAGNVGGPAGICCASGICASKRGRTVMRWTQFADMPACRPAR